MDGAVERYVCLGRWVLISGTNGSGDGTCLYSIKLPECTTT